MDYSRSRCQDEGGYDVVVSALSVPNYQGTEGASKSPPRSCSGVLPSTRINPGEKPEGRIYRTVVAAAGAGGVPKRLGPATRHEGDRERYLIQWGGSRRSVSRRRAQVRGPQKSPSTMVERDTRTGQRKDEDGEAEDE